MSRTQTTTTATSRKSGFSLIELMVVMGIIGVMGAAAGVEILRRKPVADLNRAAWEVMAQLRRARVQAIAQNAPCDITFDADALTCTIWTDANEDGVVDELEEHTSDLSDLSDLYLWTWPTATCSFDSRGKFHTDSAESAAQVVYLFVDGGGSKTMWIHGNGQVDLREQ